MIDDADGAGGLQRPVGEDASQVAAFNQPHVHIESAVDLAEGVYRHHMRVGETGSGERFPAEPLLEQRIGC
jgi:hypothetical protein